MGIPNLLGFLLKLALARDSRTPRYESSTLREEAMAQVSSAPVTVVTAHTLALAFPSSNPAKIQWSFPLDIINDSISLPTKIAIRRRLPRDISTNGLHSRVSRMAAQTLLMALRQEINHKRRHACYEIKDEKGTGG
jgi:hypothetical protein